jgi:methyl-accepting chemotaxis protein
MSEDKTAETRDSRSFEERVFARFDVVEGRLSNVEIRIGKLEDRQYDTKPIWEQALAAIAENNQRMREGFDETNQRIQEAFDEIAKTNQQMREGFDETNQRIQEAFDEIAKTNQQMREGFDETRAQLGGIVARLDAMDEKFKAIDERFNSQDKDLDHNFRGVERKIDVLNRNILELRADQRYVDSRLEKIESQAKPS